MKQIKIPLLLKIIVLFNNFIYLSLLILLPANIFSMYFAFGFLYVIFNFILFFFVLRNNLLAIKLQILLAILFGGIFAIFDFKELLQNTENGFLVIFFFGILTFLEILLLYISHRRIKKGSEILGEKYISKRDQSKTFAIIFFVIVLFLLIFRFGYYTREIKFSEIPENFFVTKYENLQIPDEENLFVDVKNLRFTDDSNLRRIKGEIFECIYKDICNKILEEYKIDIRKLNGENILYKRYEGLEEISYLEMEEKGEKYEKWISEMEKLDEEYKNKVKALKIISKNFLKQNLDSLFLISDKENFDKNLESLLGNWKNKKIYKNNSEEIMSFSDFMNFNKQLKYYKIYLLNNQNFDETLELLESQFETFYKMLEGDGYLIDTLVAITSLDNLFDNIEFILNNFEIDETFKNEIIKILDKEFKLEFMDNAIKGFRKYKDYQHIPKIWLTTLYDFEYTNKGFDEINYFRIQNQGKIPQDILEKYTKYNFFKSNLAGQELWMSNLDMVYESQYKKLEDLENRRKEIIQKLGE